MRIEQRPSGVTIEVPDAYDVYDRSTRSTTLQAERDELDAIDHFADVDSELLNALQADDFVEVDSFEYESDPSRRRPTRAHAEQVITVGLAPQPGETAIALVEQDGVYGWQFPRADRSERRRGGKDGPPRLVFEIPLVGATGRTRAGFAADAQMAGSVRGRILKTGTGFALKLLEKTVREGLVVMRGEPAEWTYLANPRDLRLPTDRDPHLLLFVHGTFSSTVGSFNALGSLAADDALFADMARKYDAVVGFDHRTLSAGPDENAADLLDLLRQASPRRMTIDAVSYSRGGLVLRSFGALLPETPIQLKRAVFVAATNEGTALADPENWHEFIDLYTNLVLGATRAVALVPDAAPIAAMVGGATQGLSAFVKYLADRAVDPNLVPGLAAMVPNGAFVRDLGKKLAEQRQSESIANYAVISNFEPGSDTAGVANELPKKLITRLSDPVVDRLMGNRPNDLVVDTPSMAAITGSRGRDVLATLNFLRNPVVYHTVYFTQNRLAASLRDWFELGEGKRTVRGGVRAGADVLTQVDAEVVAGPATIEARQPAPPEPESRPTLKIEVVWDSIDQATGDIYAVGHYSGLVPQRAERALDEIVSAQDGDDATDLVLTSLTRNKVLTGKLGEISFFPWGGSQKRNRLIAIAGMGDYAAFGPQRLRKVYRSLAQSIATLPDERTICTVLIGAGEGATPVPEAVTQLVYGFADAIRATGRGDKIRRVRIVENDYARALEIRQIVKDLAKPATPVDLDLAPVQSGSHGIVDDDLARSLLIRAAQSTRDPKNLKAEDFEKLLPHLDKGVSDALWTEPAEDGKTIESPLQKTLRRVWTESPSIDELARVSRERSDERDPEVQRFTFVCRGDRYVASAITDTAAVPERRISVRPSLVKQAVAKTTYPKRADVRELSELLYRLVLPREFRDLISARGSIVVEVDRDTAQIHWEMLASDHTGDPLGLATPIARQLRTQYSDAVALGSGKKDRLNVLVIGDPGDPEKRHNLPKAREEARQVAMCLREIARRNDLPITVEEFIGAPNNAESDVPPAESLSVFSRLMKGDIDVVHYAGHADFNPEKPEETGWLFHDGMFTAGEIAPLDIAPTLVFANACLTGRLSTLASRSTADALEEAALLPSLADEFLNRGVQNYIGTAWEIDDAGAVKFARSFYEAFFGPCDDPLPLEADEAEPQRPDEPAGTIGEAVREARVATDNWEADTGRVYATWPAFQHYGDPGFRFSFR